MPSDNFSASSSSSSSSNAAAAGRIALIHASWHLDIVQQGCNAFIAAMAELGYAADSIDVIAVPGAFEIPLHAAKLAASGQYAGIATCALVVDGGIYRHDFVATAVIDGLMRVQLDSGVPVFSAVLTPHHFHEHAEHRDYYLRHFQIKGRELAQACVTTVRSLERVAALVA
ncbi:6,7-dimethyl-8-ribityllumazine synthase [Xylophilus sp. GOD-11R]|uniref:6,7-dimethyl-8-ribityllumazine synthase n=1 Tax=Xylophilus sp. GOD-11R TaxID=3089814 RepID=UPI00298BE526|nr:6,7-dimethyl-8-ribityllumazine synthase [Xylophilus sp. GOD-11R]WPB59149.1 6,7-dimethyl-8-ribityllumazine synthase [Xylophilus sp. GOD-11R]